jgi:hypothetical protein
VSACDVVSDGPPGRPPFQTYFTTRFPEQENRPIWSGLRRALLEQCKLLDTASLENCKTDAEALAALQDVDKVVGSIVELFRWLDPNDGVLTRNNLDPLWKTLGAQLYGDLIQHCGKRASPGRPIERRDLAIRALELKSVDQPPTWTEIARKLCPCGKTRHDRTCADNIRRNVNRLKLVLQKHSIPIAG